MFSKSIFNNKPRGVPVVVETEAKSKSMSRCGSRTVLGYLGELLAADRLRREGYVILERNYRCSAGEIDLITREDRALVFVEVRTRTSEGFGSPIETIDFAKQRRVRAAAGQYLRERRPSYEDMRFDVVGVLLKEGEEAQIEIVPHVFHLGQLR